MRKPFIYVVCLSLALATASDAKEKLKRAWQAPENGAFGLPTIWLDGRLAEIIVVDDCKKISGVTCHLKYNGKEPLPSEIYFYNIDAEGRRTGPRTRLIYPKLNPGKGGFATFRTSTPLGNILLRAVGDGPWKNPY